MDEAETQERQRVVAIARTWLRTPFRDLAKVKGQGVDCGQLIGACFEEAGLIEGFATGYYSPQWFLHRDEEEFLRFVSQYARPLPAGVVPQIADIVVFKFGRTFAHGALIVDPGWPRIVHAYKAWGCVGEDDASIGPLAERPRQFWTRW